MGDSFGLTVCDRYNDHLETIMGQNGSSSIELFNAIDYNFSEK